MSDIYIRLLKNQYNETYVVLFEHGKFKTPILICYDWEFEKLIDQYQKEKKELKKDEK